MSKVSTWLHGNLWRPLTIAFVGLVIVFGLGFDYATAERESDCRQGNRTVELIREVIRVTFDDGTPPRDPNAPAPTVDELRAFIGQRLAGNEVYQDLGTEDRALIVDMLLIFTTETSGQSTAETRLTKLANSLQPEPCTGALVF